MRLILLPLSNLQHIMHHLPSHTNQPQPTRWSLRPGMFACAGGSQYCFECGTGSPKMESIKNILNREAGR